MSLRMKNYVVPTCVGLPWMQRERILTRIILICYFYHALIYFALIQHIINIYKLKGLNVIKDPPSTELTIYKFDGYHQKAHLRRISQNKKVDRLSIHPYYMGINSYSQVLAFFLMHQDINTSNRINIPIDTYSTVKQFFHPCTGACITI